MEKIKNGGGGKGRKEQKKEEGGGRKEGGLSPCPRGCWPLLRWPNRPLQPLLFLYPSLLFSTKGHRWAACPFSATAVPAAPAAPTTAFPHSCPTTCQAALTPWSGTKSPQRNRVSPSVVTDETLSQHQESWLLLRHCSDHYISLG